MSVPSRLSYVKRNLERSLKPGQPGIDLDEIYSALGQVHLFDNTMVKDYKIFSRPDSRLRGIPFKTVSAVKD
jgi:hypothetical protein